MNRESVAQQHHAARLSAMPAAAASLTSTMTVTTRSVAVRAHLFRRNTLGWIAATMSGNGTRHDPPCQRHDLQSLQRLQSVKAAQEVPCSERITVAFLFPPRALSRSVSTSSAPRAWEHCAYLTLLCHALRKRSVIYAGSPASASFCGGQCCVGACYVDLTTITYNCCASLQCQRSVWHFSQTEIPRILQLSLRLIVPAGQFSSAS